MEHSRVSLRAVRGGVIVGIAMQLLIAAAALTTGLLVGVVFASAAAQWSIVGVATLVAAVAGAYVAGRLAAAASRSVVRRDGALHGLVAGASTLVAGVATLIVLASAALAVHDVIGYRIDLDGIPDATFAAAVLVAGVIMLIAGVRGGIAGARAEAKASGILRVRVARRPADASAGAYERDFFTAPYLAPTDPSTRPI